MKLFSVAARKSISTTHRWFSSVYMCVCVRFGRRHTCLCIEWVCVCVVIVCEYFMTLSASLSNCMQFICVRFIFFLNSAVPCVRFWNFHVWVQCFFALNRGIFYSIACRYGRYLRKCVKCIFQFYIADMRIADGKENVRGIKKCMHRTFSGRHIFL